MSTTYLLLHVRDPNRLLKLVVERRRGSSNVDNDLRHAARALLHGTDAPEIRTNVAGGSKVEVRDIIRGDGHRVERGGGSAKTVGKADGVSGIDVELLIAVGVRIIDTPHSRSWYTHGLLELLDAPVTRTT